MEKYLKLGLLMQFFQILLIGSGIVIYSILTISWTFNLLILIIFVTFNLISIILVIVGIFKYTIKL